MKILVYCLFQKMTQIKDDMLTYDYIIVGGGTSGSVAARRIAEANINFTVCLLEAGPRFVALFSSQFLYK